MVPVRPRMRWCSQTWNLSSLKLVRTAATDLQVKSNHSKLLNFSMRKYVRHWSCLPGHGSLWSLLWLWVTCLGLCWTCSHHNWGFNNFISSHMTEYERQGEWCVILEEDPWIWCLETVWQQLLKILLIKCCLWLSVWTWGVTKKRFQKS